MFLAVQKIVSSFPANVSLVNFMPSLSQLAVITQVLAKERLI